MDLSRSELLLGQEATKKLKNSHVAVFGLGGVGGYVTEALARSGVGELTLVDDDVFSESNLNRQLFALNSTLGLFKADVAKARLLDINPKLKIHAEKVRFGETTKNLFDFSRFSYVADAIDTVTSKLLLAEICYNLGVKEISCMGMGNKLDPCALEVADVFSTSVCPLAKVMRKELKSRGVERLKAVYSKELPVQPLFDVSDSGVHAKRKTVGSVSFVPSAAGLIMAGEIIKDIVNCL